MTIEINDNEIEKYLDCLNNGIVALNDVYGCFFFNCEIPRKWLKWQGNRSNEECLKILGQRLDKLKELYNKINMGA